ncbi:MAG: thioesterase family protein [Vicinamibacterales bacterium]
MPRAAAIPTDRTRRTTSRIRVRYAETDKMGVVYHANYFVWFEVGRCDLLRTLGWSYREMEESGVALPVVEATCRYHVGSRYDDELEVATEGRLVSPVRLSFDYEIQRCADGRAIVSGRTIHAAVNPAGRPCRLPERIRVAFS